MARIKSDLSRHATWWDRAILQRSLFTIGYYLFLLGIALVSLCLVALFAHFFVGTVTSMRLSFAGVLLGMLCLFISLKIGNMRL